MVFNKMGSYLGNSRNAQISVTILLFIFFAVSIFHRKAEKPFIHELAKTFKQEENKTHISVQTPECSELVSEYVEHAGRVNISEQVVVVKTQIQPTTQLN